MNRDAKEIVGVLMQILGGAEVSHDQLTELSFEADGELQGALNEAYIRIVEFAYDRELRIRDPALDRAMRGALQASLDRIVAAWDAQSQMTSLKTSAWNGRSPRVVDVDPDQNRENAAGSRVGEWGLTLDVLRSDQPLIPPGLKVHQR